MCPIISYVLLLLYVTKNNVLCNVSENVEVPNDETGELLFVQMIMRHGDRTPIKFYKNDPFKNIKYWDVEPGELTNLGRQHQFELGKWLRERYSNFIDFNFYNNRIYVQSSAIDRTIMSAELVMAAMYSPTNTEILNSNLPWQPIPVYTIPISNDNLIVAMQACQTFDEYFRDVIRVNQAYHEKHNNLYNYLSLHSGEKADVNGNAILILDAVSIEATTNKTLPDWTKKILPGGEFHNNLKELSLHYFSLDTSTSAVAKFKAGFLLKDILDRFLNKSKEILEPDRSMWIYSGHDSTICRILNTLGVLESLPPFSACVLFEMRNINNIPHIQIFYKNSSVTPIPLDIPKCGVSCPLANFYEIYKEVLPTNTFEEECSISKKEHSDALKIGSNFSLAVSLGIVSVLHTKLLVFCKCCNF